MPPMPLSAETSLWMFARSAVIVPAEVGLTVVWVRLSSDLRSEVMCWHAAFLLLLDAGDPEWTAACGFAAALVELDPELHAASSVAPATARPATIVRYRGLLVMRPCFPRPVRHSSPAAGDPADDRARWPDPRLPR